MSNHRVQVFTAEGEFKYIIYTSGSPIGVVIDPQQRLYVVDPFAHAIDIYELGGSRITGFGGPGLDLGRFRFPSDIALDERGRIFVSDRENNQIQVWGWPSGIIPPIEIPEEAADWAICLSPLLLLLIPLLRRRTEFLTTADFIEAMRSADAVQQMNDRKFRWVVTEALWEQYADQVSDGVRFEELLHYDSYSRTDVEDLMEKAGIDVELKSVTASVFFSSDVANPDTYTKFFSDIQMYTTTMTQPDPELFMNQYCSWEMSSRENKWQGRNIVRWASADYDNAYKAAQGELDPVKRAALFIRMNDLVSNNNVVIPLVYRPRVAAVSNRLYAPLSGWDNDLWNLKDWYRADA